MSKHRLNVLSRRRLVERFRGLEHEIQRLHRMLQRRRQTPAMVDYIHKTIIELESDRAAVVKRLNRQREVA